MAYAREYMDNRRYYLFSVRRSIIFCRLSMYPGLNLPYAFSLRVLKKLPNYKFISWLFFLIKFISFANECKETRHL